MLELDPSRAAMQFANRLNRAPQKLRDEVLSDLRKRMPSMARLVEQILRQMAPGETAGDVKDKMKPLPQARAPRRTMGVI